MSDADDLLPHDDSFVRTAIQGLRVPPHLPDFWDQLAAHLDDALDEMSAQERMSQGLTDFAVQKVPVPELAVPEPSPHHVEDPWPDGPAEPTRAQPVQPGPAPRREPLRARGPQVFVDAPAAATHAPRRLAAAPRVDHDRSVVPHSLRRASNAVLLVVALLAAALAIVAALTLVHQRSGSAAPAPSLAPRASLH